MSDPYRPRSRGSITPYFFALALVLAGLKGLGVFPWSWWWVLAPLWGPTAIALAGSALALVWVVLGIVFRGGPQKTP